MRCFTALMNVGLLIKSGMKRRVHWRSTRKMMTNTRRNAQILTANRCPYVDLTTSEIHATWTVSFNPWLELVRWVITSLLTSTRNRLILKSLNKIRVAFWWSTVSSWKYCVKQKNHSLHGLLRVRSIISCLQYFLCLFLVQRFQAARCQRLPD